jgi:CheY-like chemotaxis protein
VVDDEEDILTYLGALLEDSGFEVVFARDGSQALDMAMKKQPDLITLDISMPEHSGTRAYRELKTDENFKKIPVFIITAFNDMKHYLKKLVGFPFPEAFITKPVDPAELRKLVAEQFQQQ